MKLDRVEIKNFRSIKEVTVNLNPPCRVLVGINESGKSNILQALALMSNDYDPVKSQDEREALPGEGRIKESYVRFIFKFEKSESDKLYERLSSKCLAKVKNPEIVVVGTKKKSVKEFSLSKNEGLYVANIMEENKSFKYWSISGSHKIIPGWKVLSEACPADFTAVVKGQTHKLSDFKFFRSADLPEIPENYFVDAKIDDFEKAYGHEVIEIVRENLPDTLFWEYDEENLLPNVVKIEAFANDPDSCVPLKNMFILAGIKDIDIKTSLEEAKKRTHNQFQNYLDKIADKTTAHFRDVWKEYRKIEFSLRLNADEIIPGIKEKNTHDFARRSDGFKRFVTFLLMISVNVETDNIQNTLLLIDEPDISLHPSGARYLRDELIRISKKNYVVYSTHSIFMIDSGDIGRHYIVKKDGEITTIEDAKSSNIADEEVLFNALGHSVFAFLKEKNLIFEGWNDKRLFKIALEGMTAQIQRKYKDVGVCHAKGVGTIKAITPMIELAKRECLIISDNDGPAKQEQKQYLSSKGCGKWLTYKEVDSTLPQITGEDFIKNDFITKQVNANLESSMPKFVESELPADSGKLSAIHKWLTTNGMTKEQANDTLNKIKDSIFENLKSQHIEPTYTKLLQKIPL